MQEHDRLAAIGFSWRHIDPDMYDEPDAEPTTMQPGTRILILGDPQLSGYASSASSLFFCFL